jgi:conjugal transfer/entry exclusion protein
MLNYIVLFAVVMALSTTAFVVVAVLWLRKLRETVSGTLAESVNQQIRTAHRLGEAVAQVQKQQRTYEQQLQNLAQANMRLRQELATVAHRLEHTETDPARGDRTVH